MVVIPIKITNIISKIEIVIFTPFVSFCPLIKLIISFIAPASDSDIIKKATDWEENLFITFNYKADFIALAIVYIGPTMAKFIEKISEEK